MMLCICFDWNALTAIGTLLLAFITYLTVKQNDSQLQEMKRQWEDAQSPDLDFSLIYLPYRVPEESLAIEIKNFGKGVADGIRLFFDKDFIGNFPHKAVREYVSKVAEKTYRILPGETKVIPICKFDNNKVGCDKLFGQPVSEKERKMIHQYLANFTFNLVCVYNGKKSPYKHTFTAEDKEWGRNTVSDKLEDITDSLYGIERSIDTIASNM